MGAPKVWAEHVRTFLNPAQSYLAIINSKGVIF